MAPSNPPPSRRGMGKTEVEYEVWVAKEGDTQAKAVTTHGLSRQAAEKLFDDCNRGEAEDARKELRQVNKRYLLVKCSTTRQLVR